MSSKNSIWLIFFLFTLTGYTQRVTDTAQVAIKDTSYHSPKKATLLSAILPGAGQLYNKKWWKVPIVYAGLGTSAFFIITNNRYYRNYRNEYLFRVNNPGLVSDFEDFDEQDLLVLQDTYRRWRDLSVISFVVVYVLNIVDASVDAHLYNFDVSPDLGMNITPYFSPQLSSTFGVSLTLKLK